MQHVLKQMQYIFAVIYETLDTFQLHGPLTDYFIKQIKFVCNFCYLLSIYFSSIMSSSYIKGEISPQPCPMFLPLFQLSVCLSFFVSFSVFVWLLSVCLHFCLSVSTFFYLFVCLTIRLSVCLHLYLYLSLFYGQFALVF